MATVQRPSFFEGQILGANDLARGVEYAREQDARHERYLHSWGLAHGFELEKQGAEWVLSPGFAVDSAGAPIALTQTLPIDEEQFRDEAFPSERDDEKWFPVFVLRTEAPAAVESMLQRCGSPEPSRTAEGAAVQFRSFASGWDDQDPPEVGDELERDPDRPRVVLIGFVQWKAEPKPNGQIVAFQRRDPKSGFGPRYAGVAADDVVAQGGELALWSLQRGRPGAPAALLGDHRKEDDRDRKALRLGIVNGGGGLNEILTVDPKGNVYVKGNLRADGVVEGKLTKGEVSIESGVAVDGMTLPLPPGIAYEQVASGDVALHVSVTPRLDRQVDPDRISDAHLPIVVECSVDDDLSVKCAICWTKLDAPREQILLPGSVDYSVVAYVKKAESGGAA